MKDRAFELTDIVRETGYAICNCQGGSCPLLALLFSSVFVFFGCLSSSLLLTASAASSSGPLRVHPENLRYFADNSGRAITLTGSHTWANLQDQGPQDPPPVFDFERLRERVKKAGGAVLYVNNRQ